MRYLDEHTQALIKDMHYPVRCTWCSHVYDLGKVEVTARYVDCSMWKCPGCKNTVDDRGETGWKSRKDYERLDKVAVGMRDLRVDLAGRERRRNGGA